MKRNVRGWAELTVRNVACLALGATLAGCASDARPVVVGQPITLPSINDYCAAAQKDIANSRVPARNVIVTDYAAFARATPSLNPLETLQYVGYADDKQSKPRMISCKLHSAEQIRAQYGATAAGESTTCARLNRRTLDAVMVSLSERQKKKMPFNGALPVALDPDEQATSEAQWLEGFTMVQADAGGTLRIRAKSLRAGTGSLRRTSSTSASTTVTDGRQYCHLIAPDYLKRILAGEVQLPKAEFPLSSKNGQTAAR
jgi:hypothetical protein